MLSGPIVGLTASEIRRLGRHLRAQHHEAGVASPSSEQLIREFVVGVPQRSPFADDDPITVTVGRLRILLARVHEQPSPSVARRPSSCAIG